ncbi:hypothetical protein JDS99_05545 [Bacillus cereus group sp. N6]|uniref:hypothetical protein n=1 Tax=Bacillus cereus group sp. N6 TaxID=2794583 RepID=UPI0018F67916|nr:hypothetical protein [Bacillus cereus group sp. N6]MBJ8109115.1 hypothetical protein [Bacillus cereus group sp. N6]
MNQELTPSEYFEIIKGKKNTIDDQELVNIYDNCLTLLNKYKITGQTKAIKKLIFHLETIEKERSIVQAGINTFVYRDDIEEFIENISKDTVKIQDLESYEREIPDDVVAVLETVKDKFDQFYVVFTDYTGKVEKQVTKERRDKDPILFGTFQDEKSRTVIDRFYFIGDWEDEYCDLTLDKMVNKVQASKGKNISMTIKTPIDIKELKEQLSLLEEHENRFMMGNKQKPGFFKKISTFFSKKH